MDSGGVRQHKQLQSEGQCGRGHYWGSRGTQGRERELKAKALWDGREASPLRTTE